MNIQQSAAWEFGNRVAPRLFDDCTGKATTAPCDKYTTPSGASGENLVDLY
jgi:hypothetical protein